MLKQTVTLAIAAVLLALPVLARTTDDEIQAPRSVEVRAPRSQDVQAPRDRDERIEAPRRDEPQAPRG